jgi:DNA adenine methylase
LKSKPTEFIESFAGGAIVGLTIAFEELAYRVKLVEIDEKVGAVWQAIIEEGYGEWLAQEIEAFTLTAQNIETLLEMEDLPIYKKAFQTIVHNRVSRGGIITKGAGLIKNGEDGKGLASRWYPQTLSRRIRNIHRIRDRLTFVWGDAIQVIEQNKERADVVFFVDPPYTAGSGKQAGRRLYTYSELDHERLFGLMETVQGDFVMTYDDSEDVQKMADRHDFDTRSIPMRTTHHAATTELLIGRDLSWID